MPNRAIVAFAVAGCLAATPASQPAEPSAGYSTIARQCLACHGEARMGGLDLRTREAALAGGKRGPALAPGDPDASLLFQALAHAGELAMPPGRERLPDADLAAVRAWIAAGAGWPAEPVPARAEPSWWSFRPPVKPAPPAVPASAPVRNEIDRFIQAKLDERGLAPNPEADRRTLIRRLTFDLHGLPPAPEEIEAFVADPDPRAYEKLVERLLASPRYGERWGRHWLDVVRYADTGGFETDVYFRHAWRYRDYVIESFNRDKPFDQFVREQVAADELWPVDLDLEGSYNFPEAKKENVHRWLGTGLYTLGAFPVEITFFGDQYRAEWQAEAVDVTGSAFLGLTLGCARCHDHKFDPIPQRDYYRLSAMFAGSEEREVPIVDRMKIYEFTRHEARWKIVEEIEDEIRRLDRRVAERKGAPAPEAADADAPPEVDVKGYLPAERDLRESLLRKLGEAYLKAPRPVDRAQVLVPSGRVRPTYVLERGEWSRPAERVEPGYLTALHPGPSIDEPEDEFFLPRRRKALAEWLTAPENPLLARVMVNRIWLWHFGRGLVETPNDFGRQGAEPSHPDLLDWLAVEFRERGWSVKEMHRLILHSAAYRRASTANERNQAKDPENVLLWRANRRRIEAEALRDAALAVSGRLNLEAGGPAVVPELTGEEMQGMRDASQWPVTSDPAQHDRRSVYLFVKRSFRLPMFQTFDAPDPALSCARREASTVAPQALTLMNGDFFLRQAEALAARLRAEAGDDREAQAERAWRLALGRAPDADERARAAAFLAEQPLERLGLLVLNLSEFLYVD